MRPRPTSGYYDMTYAGDTATINPARLDLAGWIRASEFDLLAPVDDIVLVLSELVSNAIEASPGHSYRVRCRIELDRLGITVTNSGDAELPAPTEWKPFNGFAPRGRGLAIVAALADSVETSASSGATTVLAWFARTGSE